MTRPIVRGSGTTESERYLARLADRTFLNLWSYPNVFIDKRVRGTGEGKELCDLLVVSGDDVLVFSDKSISWPAGPTDLAWRRWFRRSIRKSAEQIRGAERWIDQFPDRVFTDPACRERFPFPFPPADRRRFHGIVVARGAAEACRQQFAEGSGSLLIFPRILNDAHDKTGSVIPFAVGDIFPDQSFIHVLDEVTLDVVMSELDTITDLTAYLRKKEEFVRGGHLIGAHGEEDLVAYYMTHMNSRGEHDFTKPDGSDWGADDFVTIGSHYTELRTNPRYIARKIADRDSYVWDQLITMFTDHMLAGTTLVPESEEFSLAVHGDRGLRHMAEVPRYVRRALGAGILDAMERGKGGHRFTRAFLPRPSDHNQETGFFFMTLAVPEFPLPKGYDQYRQVRRNMLETYAFMFLERYPKLKRVVGIGMEPPSSPLGHKDGSSEDLMVVEQSTWTPELRSQLREARAAYDIAVEGRYSEYGIQYDEWPGFTVGAREPVELEKKSSKRRRRREAGKNRAGPRRKR